MDSSPFNHFYIHYLQLHFFLFACSSHINTESRLNTWLSCMLCVYIAIAILSYDWFKHFNEVFPHCLFILNTFKCLIPNAKRKMTLVWTANKHKNTKQWISFYFLSLICEFLKAKMPLSTHTHIEKKWNAALHIIHFRIIPYLIRSTFFCFLAVLCLHQFFIASQLCA